MSLEPLRCILFLGLSLTLLFKRKSMVIGKTERHQRQYSLRSKWYPINSTLGQYNTFEGKDCNVWILQNEPLLPIHCREELMVGENERTINALAQLEKWTSRPRDPLTACGVFALHFDVPTAIFLNSIRITGFNTFLQRVERRLLRR